MSTTPPRSTFVTVLAWIFIVMAGSATLISIMQNLMIHVLFKDMALEQALQAQPEGVPPVAAFLAGHARLIFLGFLLVSVATLVSAIGLLRRRNWARLCFIGLMGLGILWQVVGLVLQSSVFSSMRAQFVQAAELGGPDMSAALPVIMLVSGLFALVMASLQGWIAWRLLSAPVAAEFRH